MTANNLDIDRLVREVMQRLRAMSPDGSRDDDAHGNPDGNTRQVATDRGDTGPAASPATRPPDPTKPEIRERVISLETLNGRLDAGRCIRVPQGAVLTPSARDELKRRGVQVEYFQASEGKGSSQAPLLLATWQTGHCLRSLVQAIRGDGYKTTQLETSPDSLARLVQALDQNGPPANRWGVLLTDKPSLALCLANRPPRVRAAWAVDQPSVTDALDSLAANLLIMEPARHTLPAMVGMTRAFLRGGDRTCPEVVKQSAVVRT